MASIERLCPFCGQQVQPRDDGGCPSCQQMVFPPRDAEVVASHEMPADGSSEDPLGFLAAENNVLRAGKWADEIADKEEQERILTVHAMVSPLHPTAELLHPIVGLLLKSRLFRVFAVTVTLGAMVFWLLAAMGIINI